MTANTFIPGLLDRHFAAFLTARSGLGGEDAAIFRRLVTDLSAAMAAGHVCLPVASEEAEVLRRSPLVSDGGPTPLVLVSAQQGGRLYLHRYYRYEQRLATQLLALAQRSYAVDNLAELLDGCFRRRTARRTGSARPPRWPCSGRSASSPADREPARPIRSPRSSPCCSRPAGPVCAWPWRRPPARRQCD